MSSKGFSRDLWCHCSHSRPMGGSITITLLGITTHCTDLSLGSETQTTAKTRSGRKKHLGLKTVKLTPSCIDTLISLLLEPMKALPWVVTTQPSVTLQCVWSLWLGSAWLACPGELSWLCHGKLWTWSRALREDHQIKAQLTVCPIEPRRTHARVHTTLYPLLPL